MMAIDDTKDRIEKIPMIIYLDDITLQRMTALRKAGFIFRYKLPRLNALYGEIPTSRKQLEKISEKRYVKVIDVWRKRAF